MKHSHKHCKLESSNNTSGSWVKNCPTQRTLDGWDCRAPMRSGWAIPYASLLGQVCSLEARSPNLRHFRAFSTPEHAASRQPCSRHFYLRPPTRKYPVKITRDRPQPVGQQSKNVYSNVFQLFGGCRICRE